MIEAKVRSEWLPVVGIHNGYLEVADPYSGKVEVYSIETTEFQLRDDSTNQVYIRNSKNYVHIFDAGTMLKPELKGVSVHEQFRD